MKKLGISVLISWLLAPQAFAQTLQQSDAIYKAVEEHITQELANAPSAFNDVKTAITPLDSRLRLQACEAPLQTITEFGNIKQKHLTIKVSCEAPVKWALRVPVKLQIFQHVVVASQPISRDQILTPRDVQVLKQDIAQLGDGYFQAEEELIGLSSVKSIQPGSVIKRHMVRQPLIIHRGETVKMVVSYPGFNLEAAGVAQMDGAVGDTIKVKNARSNKIIDAKVKGSGEVSI
ncbi:flagellar basal body P-ring formation chaperone FlgA [Candidatus Berkiella aquae]|uniref:Flagella basal body P-ring formation protein FlgA n=1 Tax=Candidatus Berkiella aquae TaxID=295108 RepID=A0A0Q9YLA0_9GAMM|nr:flagellar basal body P-ring formation chaperone FlgA [Candidatus Berkiella aquae]MCS5711448.1 flagellar basal body P-ring formation protein FlgA [Candidatus Berkiella aquae]